MRIVRIRDVIFDKTLFYDLAKLDSRHLLITNVKNTLKILKISNNIFFEMIIEKENENDLSIDHLKDESIESRLKEEVDQSIDSIEKAFFLHIVMKESHLLISEMISNRDQKEFSANIIDTMSLLQIDLKIDKMLNSNQNQDQKLSILSSSIENDSHSQSSTKSKKNKQRATVSNDVVIMNIRFRKQTYSIALIIIQTLKSFHAAFSIDLKRSNQKKSQISKLHRNDLLVESRYWRQMLRHRFSQKFQIAAQKEFSELEKRKTFFWVKKSNQSRILLTWVFKYKFDIDDYLKKFKTRLCVRDDLQSIDQNTYATTLAAKTFRVLMIISTAFDLKIWQYDAVNAFINNEIDEKLYNEKSNEFSRFDYCWRLNKTLYELKQASILWYRNLITILKDLELQSISKINCLFVNDWLIFFFYVDDIMTIFMKKKRESNAILWEITNETIRNENSKEIEMIFKNKNHSKSSKSQNLIMSKLIHQQDNDKISLERNEMLKNIVCASVTNQWECRKFESDKIELAKSLCLSAKSEIVEFCSCYFQIRHSLFYCKTRSILEKLRFELCDDRKSNYCLSQWH